MNGHIKGARIVVKVGGSLYDFPALKLHLNRFLDSLGSAQIAIFPGGGSFTEVVRQLDSGHVLGQETSHWLAVRSLSLAAHFLHQMLEPRGVIVSTFGECETIWAEDGIGIIDPFPFARSDAASKDALPLSWDVTSDSLSLRLAQRWEASRLVLLKSASAPCGWPAISAPEFVDGWFQQLFAEKGNRVAVSAINLREEI